MIAEKDTIIANLQANLAQAHDARLFADDARKHTEAMLLQATARLTQLEANATHHSASSTHAHGNSISTRTLAGSAHATSPPRTAAASPAAMLDEIAAALHSMTSAQEIDALCVRMKDVLTRAKQRRVELQQVVQQRKIDELESSLTCPICMDQKKNVSCVPCGHALCRACAEAVSGRGNRKCPICREVVQHTNAIYL